MQNIGGIGTPNAINICLKGALVEQPLPFISPSLTLSSASQIENGVGMLTSLASEFDFEMDYLEGYLDAFQAPRKVSLITGEAAHPHLSALCKKLEERVDGLEITVHRIVNNFFGESVTVAGLLTGCDVLEQLRDKPLGDEIIFPTVMLKADEEIFLDDMTPDELSQSLGVPMRACRADGAELIQALLGVRISL